MSLFSSIIVSFPKISTSVVALLTELRGSAGTGAILTSNGSQLVAMYVGVSPERSVIVYS